MFPTLGFSSSFGAAGFFHDGVLLFSLQDGGLVSSTFGSWVFDVVLDPTELRLFVVFVEADVDTDE